METIIAALIGLVGVVMGVLAFWIRAGFQDLRSSMDQGFAAAERRVDGRFEQVDGRFEKVDGRFDKVDGRFEKVDGRFDKVDGRFEKVDGRFDKVDGRFEKVDGRFDKVDERFDKVDGRFDRVEVILREHGERLARMEGALAASGVALPLPAAAERPVLGSPAPEAAAS